MKLYLAIFYEELGDDVRTEVIGVYSTLERAQDQAAMYLDNTEAPSYPYSSVSVSRIILDELIWKETNDKNWYYDGKVWSEK